MNARESRNPYIIDEPVADERGFFGREKELSWVAEVLGPRGVRRMVLVQGSYHIGKTSFFYQARRTLPQTTFVVDLSGEEDGKLGQLLWRAAMSIASTLQQQTGSRFPEPEINDFLTDSSHFHETFLPLVYKTLKRRRLILAFDGFDFRLGEEDTLTTALLHYLNGLMESGLNLSCLVAVEDWINDEQTLLEGAHLLRLGTLDDTSATDLIVQPARGALEFDYQAVRRILEMSSGHPYFAQLVCHVIFERCVVAGRVSDKDVDAVLPEAMELASPYVERLWSSVSPQARTVLAALASARGARGILLEQDLRYVLRRRGSTLSFAEISRACQELVEADALETLGSMSYRFRVELVREWLRSRRGLESLLYAGRGTKMAATAGEWVARFLWPLIGLLSVTAVVFLCLLNWPPVRGVGEASATPIDTPEASSLSYSLASPTPDLRLTPTPIPTPVSPTLDIAYMHRDEGSENWNIFAMSRDGSVVERLTSSNADDSSPVWSADHRWLTFVSRRDGNQEIYRLDMDGSDPVNLSNNAAADWTPSISPDGTKVVFSSLRDGNWELFMMDADGSQPARMTFNQEPDYSPAWSPDGSKIAFVSERDGNLEIYVMNADGSQESRLTFNEAIDLSPAWSPDGSLIAFESYRDDNMEIYVMNADGSEQRNLTNYPTADDHGPSWSEDGFAMVFYSNRDGNWDLYLMNAQGGDARNLTNSPGLEQEPFWGS